MVFVSLRGPISSCQTNFYFMRFKLLSFFPFRLGLIIWSSTNIGNICNAETFTFCTAAGDCTAVGMATTYVGQVGDFLSSNGPHLPDSHLGERPAPDELAAFWAASTETPSLGGSAGMLTCVLPLCGTFPPELLFFFPSKNVALKSILRSSSSFTRLQ